MDIDDDAPSSGGGDDLRAALTAAMEASDRPEAAEAPSNADHAARDEGESASGQEPVERHRDAHGKFAPKPAETPTEGTEDKPQATPEAPAEAAPAAAARPAPNSWRAEAKGAWASIPPAAQEDILRREREADVERQQHAAARKAVQEFDAVVAPHRDMLARGGGSPAQAFAVLLNAQATLEKDPVSALQQIAHTYGLQITGLNRAAPEQRPAPAAPQRQAPAPDPRAIVREELAAYQQQQALNAEITAFSKDRPHFEALKPTMVALIQSGQATDLSDAYDKASWLDPSIRSQLIAAQAAPAVAQVQGAATEAAAQARAAADQARVAKARNAGGSVRGAPGGTSAKPGERSLREELEAQFAGR